MRSGLSLVEVLVALAIFALAAVGLSAAYGNILLARAALSRAEADDEALRLARAAALSPEFLSGRTVGAAGERGEGRLSLSDGTTAEWEAEVAGAEVDALFLVRLKVRREGEETPRSQEFLLYRPSWAATADRQARLREAGERLRASRGFEGTSGSSAAAGGSGRPSIQRLQGPGVRDAERSREGGGAGGRETGRSGPAAEREGPRPPRPEGGPGR